MKAFWNVFYREIERIWSRPIYLVVVFLLPLICFLFWGTFMHSGLPLEIPVGVIDKDNTSLSRNMVRQIGATQQCRFQDLYANFSEAREAMQRGEIYAFFEIPADFQRDVLTGKQPQIDFYYSSVFLIAGSLLNKDLSIMTSTLSAGVTLKMLTARGVEEQVAIAQIRPVAPEFFAIGNPWLNYSVYLVNVLLPGLLSLLVLLMTVYTVGVELKMSTGRKWLRAADNNMLLALLAKGLPYTICFTVIFWACDIMLYKVLNFPLHNSVGWMFLASFCLVIASQALGVFMIEVFPVLRDGLSFASLFGMLSFSFAGLSFPVEAMLPMMRSWSYMFPVRHYFLIYQDIALFGFEPLSVLPRYACFSMFLLLPLLLLPRLKKALIYDRYPKK